MNTHVVLVTGGLTGIGRATALAFAKEGAQVVVSGRRDEDGQKLVSEIRNAGAEAEFIHADVRREEEVRNLIDKTVERFGHLDVAVNTAGTEGVPGPITEQTADSYAATFDTNVLGTLLSMKHELRVMLPQKNGSIVNISSTYGHTGASGGFCLFRQQTCGGGTHEVGGAGSGRDRRAGECHCPRTNRNTNAESLHENRRKKSRFGLERPAKARGKTRRDCSSNRFCLFQQSLFHYGSFLPGRRRQNGPVTFARIAHYFKTEDKNESDHGREEQRTCA